MAIAFGGVTESSAGGIGAGTSTLTFSSPNISGSDTILWVGVYAFRMTSIDSVTHNGDAMTQAATVSAESTRILRLYYRVAPDTGVNDVVVSCTGSSGDRGIRASAQYYTGASQTGVPDAFATAGPTGTTPFSVTPTVVATDCWIVSAACTPGATLSLNSGGTQRAAQGTADEYAAMDSNGTVSTGAVAISWNGTTADNNAAVACSFAPAAGGGGAFTPIPTLLTLGVG